MEAKLIKMLEGYIVSLTGDIDDIYAITNKELAEEHGFYSLPLKNCQAIESGYDLDELANELLYSKYPFHPSNDSGYWLDMYKEGFQKALEILGDKKFSEKQLRFAYNRGSYDDRLNNKKLFNADKYIQSLQQTEWEVEIVMGDPIGIGDKYTPDTKPKLDENGCLILKRIKGIVYLNKISYI